MELPQDLIDFLDTDKQLEYDCSSAEPGQIELLCSNELELEEVWLEPENGEGYYAVPAVNLVAECDGYDPEFILMWLPNEKAYGAWDCDHWEITIFEGVTWTDITNDPLKYVNSQWETNGVGKKYRPTSYPLKAGRPF